MVMSQKLTAKRIDEIKRFPVTFDDDIPEFTADQIAGFKPGLPVYANKNIPKSVPLDDDVWQALASTGRNSTAQINTFIRNALKNEKILA